MDSGFVWNVVESKRPQADPRLHGTQICVGLLVCMALPQSKEEENETKTILRGCRSGPRAVTGIGIPIDSVVFRLFPLDHSMKIVLLISCSVLLSKRAPEINVIPVSLVQDVDSLDTIIIALMNRRGTHLAFSARQATAQRSPWVVYYMYSIVPPNFSHCSPL